MGVPDLTWLLAAFAAGAAMGWLLGRRPRGPAPRPETVASPPALPEQPLAQIGPAEPQPLPRQQESTPTLPAAVSAEETPAIANDDEALPAEIQALLDKGRGFDAVKQLRQVRGGLAARALAQRCLQPGACPLPADIARLARSGNKIGAIHRLCEQTHMDLRLAHEIVEHFDASRR